MKNWIFFLASLIFFYGANGYAETTEKMDPRDTMNELFFELNQTSSPSSPSLIFFPLIAHDCIDSSWHMGYEVTVTLTNNTNLSTTSWTATFHLPQGQSIRSLWNGVYTVNGQHVIVQNPRWIEGGIIPPGSSTTFGMVVSKPVMGIPNLIDLQAIASSYSQAPIPAAPLLKPITLNPTSPNSYTVSWNSVPYATSYQLEQDTTSTFSNPLIVAQGSMLSETFQHSPDEIYYYRVSASNSSGTSPYSNIQSTITEESRSSKLIQT